MHETRRTGCARVSGRLAQMLDGALAPLEAALDRGHLEACGECQRERARHERLLDSIRRLSPAREADLALHSAAVFTRLETLSAPRREPWWGRPAMLAAAAAVILLLTLLVALGSDSTPRAVDLATLDRLLVRLPSWSDVLRGLNTLPRGFS